MLNKPKAIIFDWDNTLLDAWSIIHKSIQDTLIYMQREPWSLEETKARTHFSMRDFFPKLFGSNAEKAGKYYKESYLRNRANTKLNLLPDAKELLEFLYNEKIYSAIVSNKFGDYLREEINTLNLSKYFNKVVGSQDTIEDKPSSMPVHLSLLGSNIKPSKEVWFIGDTIADMICAYNSGCLPVFFGEDIGSSELYNTYKPYVIFKNHKELLDAIKY